jgi:hypothetical protein
MSDKAEDAKAKLLQKIERAELSPEVSISLALLWPNQDPEPQAYSLPCYISLLIKHVARGVQMKAAVARALRAADQLLSETKRASWNVRKSLEEESLRQLEILRERKARSDSQRSVSELSEEEQEERKVSYFRAWNVEYSAGCQWKGPFCDSIFGSHEKHITSHAHT